MKLALSALLVLAALFPGPARAEQEYDVKAAYLFKFTKFVEWPAAAFEDAQSPFVVGIVGRDPFNGEFDRVVAGNTVGKRPLQVKHLGATDIADLRSCQMLFVSASERRRLRDILEALEDRPVLVVGESDDFARSGGMMGFALRENRIGIEINPEATRRARLKISSQLLNIAKIVP